MNHLPAFDLVIIALYFISMIAIGIFMSRGNKGSDEYTVASGSIPGWALGLSFYATFLSAITFLGDPGKSFGANWNSFVFSLSMPFAAFIASRYFVPFYRNSHEISAYTHLERRFGAWARTYAMICFVLIQLARMGTIFYSIALTIKALTGFSMPAIMVTVGSCIILYTMLGGMKAVIWTEVIQAIIKTLGALLILYLIISELDGGIGDIIKTGTAEQKFSLGSFDPTQFSVATFWVVFLYGFFINLNNFGIDQNYIQRYHTARNNRDASKSIWMCVLFYVPVSMLFFFIGTALYTYYQQHPELILSLKQQVAAERNIALPALTPADYGDRVLPFFMRTEVPQGLLGLIIAAILSAAMSTMSSGMNSSATVFLKDIYLRHINKNASARHQMRVLYTATGVMGILAISFGIGMIGVKSLLDAWWKLAGIFSGGILGLFLLGLLAKKAKNMEAVIAVIIGVLVIIWLTFSRNLPEQYDWLRTNLHANMTIVVGTLTIFLIGTLLSAGRKVQDG
jgi:SSS family solute:Na+ symporter